MRPARQKGVAVAQLGADDYESLQRRLDALAALLDLHCTGTLLADNKGIVLFVSRSAARLIGRHREDVYGRPWQEVLPLAPDDRCALFERLRGNECTDSLVVRMPQADGSRHSVGIEIKSARGLESHSVFFLHDLADLYDLPMVPASAAPMHGLHGESTAMQLVHQQIEDLARVDSTVLLSGETGTGKEVVARAIHHSSDRRNKPYIAVNCAGLTESLLVSQLFGHRRGAFTERSPITSGSSRPPTEARSFSTRSATFHPLSRPRCCGSCRSARL